MLPIVRCLVRGYQRSITDITSCSRLMSGFKQGRGTGDQGKSSLFNNERRWKDDVAFEALGTTDELASLVGVCGMKAEKDHLKSVHDVLLRLQCCLQDILGHLATPPDSTHRKKDLTKIDYEMVDWVNGEIDRFGDQLPPLRQFILSGGGETAATLQFARTVCRRAERSIVPLVRDEDVDPAALKFLNRTSDLLFVLGRFSCMKLGQEELTYMKPKTFTGKITLMKEIRYDRQLRLWGEEGQTSIESTSVFLLGSGALATEVLKSLVLAGVSSFCIVDDAVVTTSDLGSNFFLTETDVGKNRAESVIAHLTELNSYVRGEAIICNPAELSEEVLCRLFSFSVIVATNVPDMVCQHISEFLFPTGVPFVVARVYGLLGTIRISVKEHLIANCHDENPKPDLRLDNPFGDLKALWKETNWDELTVDELKHTPYVLLYLEAIERWRKAKNFTSEFPSSYQHRKEILEIIFSMRKEDEKGSLDSENFDEARAAAARSLQPTTVPSPVKDILNDSLAAADSSCHTPFWIICAALRSFAEEENVLPLAGSLPDMTSDSHRYSRLASAYHQKAMDDANKVLATIRKIEQQRCATSKISDEMCYRFCKNAAHIRLQRGTPIRLDEENKVLFSVIAEQSAEDGPSPAVWMFLMKAAEKFAREKGRYPGTNGVPCTIDAFDLRQRVDSLLDKSQQDISVLRSKISDDAVAEICRFGQGEPHVLASFMGGTVAQEVIKLATNQYVPLDNTLMFDGHFQNSLTLRL